MKSHARGLSRCQRRCGKVHKVSVHVKDGKPQATWLFSSFFWPQTFCCAAWQLVEDGCRWWGLPPVMPAANLLCRPMVSAPWFPPLVPRRRRRRRRCGVGRDVTAARRHTARLQQLQPQYGGHCPAGAEPGSRQHCQAAASTVRQRPALPGSRQSGSQ